jgi:pyruvyl transferase EpsI
MSIFYKIKHRIPLDIKMKLDAWKNPGAVGKWTSLAKSHKQKVYIFLAGFYQNLGDMAITLAQREFLRELFPDAEVVCISNEDTYKAIRVIKKYIKPNDLITVVGGGNMSDIYVHLETERRYVVHSFPKNRIVLFPQTILFHQTVTGKKEFQKSKQTYEKHRNLVMFARESNSYCRMKESFQDIDIKLAPDIVLSLDKSKPALHRDGVLYCFRSDKESNLTEKVRNEIKSSLERRFSKVVVTDTIDVPKEACTEECFEKTLENFWKRIKTSELVVTDRLHCMIFCAITGTPCIAVDNANKKVSGVFDDWLKECSGIHMVTKDTIIPFINDYGRGFNCSKNIRTYSWDDQFKNLREACKGRKL